MQFDVSTAMIVTSALTLVVGASLAFAVSRYPDRLRQAMHIWIGGLLLQIPVFLLFGILNAHLPGTPAIMLANGLFALAYAEMGRAVRVFAGRDARASAVEIGLIVTLILLPFVFGYLFEESRWRLIVGAVLLACLSLDVARSIFKGRRLRAADYLTGGLFVVIALPMLLRSALEGASFFVDVDQARSFARTLFFVTGSGLPLIATIGFLLMCNDLINDELSRLARLDPLTGVFNRRTFDERAEHAIAEAARLHLPLSLLAVDIDHFKQVNDEFGHEGGDEALRLVVARMRECLAEGQILSRIGGEEFAVLLPGADEQEASAIAERLRRHLERSTVRVGDSELFLKISAGVATLSPAMESHSTLLRAADRALYAAKRAGRNRIATSSSLVAATG